MLTPLHPYGGLSVFLTDIADERVWKDTRFMSVHIRSYRSSEHNRLRIFESVLKIRLVQPGSEILS